MKGFNAQFNKEMSRLDFPLQTGFPDFTFIIRELNAIVFFASWTSCFVHFDFGFFRRIRFLFIGFLSRDAFLEHSDSDHFLNSE